MSDSREAFEKSGAPENLWCLWDEAHLSGEQCGKQHQQSRIDALTAERDALRAQLGQGEAVADSEIRWSINVAEPSEAGECKLWRSAPAPQSKPVTDEQGAPKNYKKLSEWLEHENSVLKAKVRELENAKPVDEREAFEQKVRAHFDPMRADELLYRNESGNYEEFALMLAWEVWQARAALGGE